MNNAIDIRQTMLSTDRLILRPWQAEDLDDFYAYASVDGVGQMAGWLPHTSKEISRERLDRWMETGDVFAIEHRASGCVIGSIGIHRSFLETVPGWEQRPVNEIGYVLSRDYWGQGLMPEAVRRVLSWLFSEQNRAAVTVAHYAFNNRSRRVIEKCGFVYYDTVLHTAKTGETHETLRYVIKREAFAENGMAAN